MASEELKIDARRNKIIEILNKKGHVRVSQLSKDLNTSMVTIRSDLNALERDGYLERIQGGAIQTAFHHYNRELLAKKKHMAAEKKRIANALADLIEDGDTLIMNSGTTTYYAAVALKDHKNLNIVTNSLAIAVELGACPTFKVILLGGEINAQHSFTYGNDVLEQLKRYKAKHAILSIDGVCVDEGVSTIHAEEVMVARMMMERSNDTIIIADHSKLGKEGFMYVCDLQDINKLITDKKADPERVKEIREANVQVILG
ncbi:MAG: DeoR/GlpR family DNA-binding transcription regulator [Caldicoprobacterales bacterium]